MLDIEVNRNPSRRELRQFSAALGVLGTVAGYIVFRTTASLPAAIVWSAGAILACLGLAVPPRIRMIYLALSYLLMPVGAVVSLIVLALVYYIVVTPIGVVMRLAGRDPLMRRRDPDAETYWLRRKASTIQRYFRQF